MKAIKFNYTLVFLGMILCVLQSCSVQRYKAPDEPVWAIGTLKSSDPSTVRISSVDKKTATGTFHGKAVREFPDTVKIAPGYHEIIPCFLERKGIVYGPELSFYSQEEQEYIVCYKIKWDKSIRFWVENNGRDITTEN